MSRMCRKTKLNRRDGFTLVEMMVSIAIIAVMSAVVLFSQRDFQKKTEFNSVVTSLATEIRTMQTSGISSVRNPLNANDFSPRLGFHFQYNNPICSPSYCDPDQYIEYVDVGPEELLTDIWFDAARPCGMPGVRLECYALNRLPPGHTFSKISAANNGVEQHYVFGDVVHSKPQLNITFQRPNPGSTIHYGDPSVAPVEYDEARIEIMSPEGSTSTIHIFKSGQVYVD